MPFLYLGGVRSPPSSHNYEVPLEHTYLVTISDTNWRELTCFVIYTELEADETWVKVKQICLDNGPHLFVEVEKVPELSDNLIKELVSQLGPEVPARSDPSPGLEVMNGERLTDEPRTSCLFPPPDAYASKR